jgi:uncharacterized membrane-anchored protein YitT (DUF2179 family)
MSPSASKAKFVAVFLSIDFLIVASAVSSTSIALITSDSLAASISASVNVPVLILAAKLIRKFTASALLMFQF